MANLKEQILQVLNGNGKLHEVSKIISSFQKNLLKNHSNPVFNQDDKNKILNGYSLLQKLGEALYRYDTLNQCNSDTQAEKINVEKSLESGISNAKYIWHSEKGEHTCEKCKALDGKVFEFYDEVPERPHPNCKCTVEIVETGKEQINNPNSQPQTAPKQSSQNWIMPCQGRIVGQYGEQRSTHVHNGIDIAVPVGTPIKAIADGTVVVVGPSNGYGYWIGINHGLVNGIKVSSEYGHISKWLVNKGQIVKKGQIIAISGNEGYSQGPHLHLTIRHGSPGKGGGIPINPWNYIDKIK